MESILAITNNNSEVKIYTARHHRTTTGMLEMLILSGKKGSLSQKKEIETNKRLIKFYSYKCI